jgi:hypothetical protein
VCLLALPLAACVSAQVRSDREQWKNDWNARVDGARTDWQHPCATRPFIAWADGFLADCTERNSAACDSKQAWVEERVEQCRAWTAWQLRNFNQHERIEGTAPSMRVE